MQLNNQLANNKLLGVRKKIHVLDWFDNFLAKLLK